MAEHDLSFSPKERAALLGMSDEELIKAAANDPDAAPMSEEMLADIKLGRRVQRGGKAARLSAARRLADEAKAERDEPANT